MVRVVGLDHVYDEIFSFYNSDLFEYRVRLTLFALMFSLGLEFSPRQFLAFWRKLGLVLRSLISTLVVFPLLVVLSLPCRRRSPAPKEL